MAFWYAHLIWGHLCSPTIPGSKAEALRTEGDKDVRGKLETAKKAPFRKASAGGKKRKTIHPIILETKGKDVIAKQKTHAKIWK